MLHKVRRASYLLINVLSGREPLLFSKEEIIKAFDDHYDFIVDDRDMLKYLEDKKNNFEKKAQMFDLFYVKNHRKHAWLCRYASRQIGETIKILKAGGLYGQRG